MPAIRECAVLGLEMPDRRMTTEGVCRACKDGIAPETETAGALQRFVKERLLPYKYPRIVEFMDGLPKTGTGKIDRQALRARGL